MKEYKTEKIRNIALVGHNGSGKTTFVERALFDHGILTRMGSVLNGTAAMDYDKEEIERNSSVTLSMAAIERKNGLKHNLLDTPGYMDFIGEVNNALKVADSALIFVEAVAGVEVGTEIVYQAAEKRGLPRLLLINKMDRENVRASRVMESIEANLDGRFVKLQLPIGDGPDFSGVVDLIKMEARMGESDERAPIPDDLADAAEEARFELVEAAAEGDDALIEKYFEEEDLSADEIMQGLRAGMRRDDVIPILYSAPEPGIAVKPVMEMIDQLMPAPGEMGEFTAIDLEVEEAEAKAAAKARAEADEDEEVEIPESEAEVSFPVSDDSPLAAFVFKTREDTYGKTSYIRVYGGALESDTRYLDTDLDEEVRVGSLQVAIGKEQYTVDRLHSGDIGVVVKLGETTTGNTICEDDRRLRIPKTEQPNPIASIAVHPVSQTDTAKLTSSLNRLVAEDPTLTWHTERATRETILSGMGTTHLDIAVKKAESKFGLHLTTTTPKVPYRETITRINSAEYTHKKQTGGAGQYARVYLRVESIEDNEEFEFESEVFGGAISQPFIPAVEKGCRQALEEGVLAGYPMVGVRAVVYDGKEHPVDSKEIAFQIAGRGAFNQAVLGAGPVLLEPIYGITVTVPGDYMGDILGDMNSRRARVQGMDQDGTKSIVRAEVPLAEVQRYAADLRSMTQGRGVFSMEFLRYGRVPANVQSELVEELKAAKKREEEEND